MMSDEERMSSYNIPACRLEEEAPYFAAASEVKFVHFYSVTQILLWHMVRDEQLPHVTEQYVFCLITCS